MTETAAVTAHRNPLDVDQVESKPRLVVWIGPAGTPLPTSATESLHPWFYVTGYLDDRPVEIDVPDEYRQDLFARIPRLAEPLLYRLPWSEKPLRLFNHARLVGSEFALAIRTPDGERCVVPRARWWQGDTDVVEVIRDRQTGVAYRLYPKTPATPSADPERSNLMQPTTAAAATDTTTVAALDIIDAINAANATFDAAEKSALTEIYTGIDSATNGVKAATLAEIANGRLALADLIARQANTIERAAERRKSDNAGNHYR